MAKQLKADELTEIMSEQLRVITGAEVDDKSLAVADSVSNMIGKTLKLAALRMAYHEHTQNGGPVIETLEGK